MAEENSELREKFAKIDKDCSGHISASELRGALQGASLTDQQVVKIISVADADSNGEIQFEEFARLDLLVKARGV